MRGSKRTPLTLKQWKNKQYQREASKITIRVRQALDAIDIAHLRIQAAVEKQKLIDNYKGISNVPLTK